ncbi:MAG TPA: diguanylate cyclase [Acidobacteriaceae bacterium]|nr:diguanylate cyclase [Acidobacteriaceae bacterium]
MHERQILLAEENEEHRAQLQEYLNRLHYSVEVHSSGLTALQRLQERDTPCMALLSSSLPQMTGLEVGLEIRRRSRRRQLWLMLMSGNPRPDEVIMATNAGIDEFLAKPVDFQDLRMRIRTGERVQNLYAELSDSAMAMEFHCTHDPLTGTWRREAILDLIFKETDRVQRLQVPVGILLLDVDGFGGLNLRYSSKAGDTLLKLLANRLRRQLRSYDTLGRYADDEFVIMLPGCSAAEAAAKAEKIRLAVENRPFVIDGNAIPITACLSVAVSSGRSPLIVLREAERALSQAKQQGPNSVRIVGEITSIEPVLPSLRRSTAPVE